MAPYMACHIMVELASELMVPGCPLFTRDTGKDWPGMGMGMNGERWNGFTKVHKGFTKGWDTRLPCIAPFFSRKSWKWL